MKFLDTGEVAAIAGFPFVALLNQDGAGAKFLEVSRLPNEVTVDIDCIAHLSEGQSNGKSSNAKVASAKGR